MWIEALISSGFSFSSWFFSSVLFIAAGLAVLGCGRASRLPQANARANFEIFLLLTIAYSVSLCDGSCKEYSTAGCASQLDLLHAYGEELRYQTAPLELGCIVFVFVAKGFDQ